jgi:hypothetical protein
MGSNRAVKHNLYHLADEFGGRFVGGYGFGHKPIC